MSFDEVLESMRHRITENLAIDADRLRHAIPDSCHVSAYLRPVAGSLPRRVAGPDVAARWSTMYDSPARAAMAGTA